MTFLMELREAARECHVLEVKASLQRAADDLSDALNALFDDPVIDTMQRANAAWARAARVLKIATTPAPPSPVMGGLSEGALMREAA